MAALTLVEPAPAIGFGVPVTMAQDAPVPTAALDSSTKPAAEAGQEIEKFPLCNVALKVTGIEAAATLTSWMPFTAGWCVLPTLVDSHAVEMVMEPSAAGISSFGGRLGSH